VERCESPHSLTAAGPDCPIQKIAKKLWTAVEAPIHRPTHQRVDEKCGKLTQTPHSGKHWLTHGCWPQTAERRMHRHLENCRDALFAYLTPLHSAVPWTRSKANYGMSRFAWIMSEANRIRPSATSTRRPAQ